MTTLFMTYTPPLSLSRIKCPVCVFQQRYNPTYLHHNMSATKCNTLQQNILQPTTYLQHTATTHTATHTISATHCNITYSRTTDKLLLSLSLSLSHTHTQPCLYVWAAQTCCSGESLRTRGRHFGAKRHCVLARRCCFEGSHAESRFCSRSARAIIHTHMYALY